MGITDFFSDIMASLSFETVHAEAPEKEDEEDKEDKEDKEDSKDEGGDEGEEKEEGGDNKDEDKEEEPEEEEEEEEEIEDPKPKLEEECARSHHCIGYKHHYDECVERVTAMHEDPDYKGPSESCVEEFFHLQHCATTCAAPKLFRILK